MRAAIVLAVVVPTLAFVAVRSLLGFARWRLQRELWRRDVEGASLSHVDHSPEVALLGEVDREEVGERLADALALACPPE